MAVLPFKHLLHKNMQPKPPKPDTRVNDAEEDEYEQRIRKTGCYDENEALQECFWKTKDWRQCQQEMKQFRECFQRHQAANTAEQK